MSNRSRPETLLCLIGIKTGHAYVADIDRGAVLNKEAMARVTRSLREEVTYDL